VVIYNHSKVITTVTLFYNTDWQHCDGMEVSYQGEKFYNINPPGIWKPWNQFVIADLI